MKKQTRIGALLLAFAMAFCLLSSSALATEASAPTTATSSTADVDAFISTAAVSNPKATKLSSAKTVSTSKIKVTWKKGSSITGYQIQYSTSSSFKKAKTTKITSYKTTSKTISSLKKNTKYYFRVRTYKTVSKKNYYSSWSSSKSAKTAKSTKSTSNTVYYTPSGNCYHRKSCSTLKRSKTIKSTSKSTAKSKGLKACKVCKP